MAKSFHPGIYTRKKDIKSKFEINDLQFQVLLEQKVLEYRTIRGVEMVYIAGVIKRPEKKTLKRRRR